MKIQVLFLALALVAAISAAPIENNSSEAPDSAAAEEYQAEDIEIDPTQYEEFLENLQEYEDLLETYLGEELPGTGLENETLLAAGLGIEVSVGAMIANDAVLGETVEDAEFLETTYGYEELSIAGLGNETLLTADLAIKVPVLSVYGDYMVLGEGDEDESPSISPDDE